MTDKSNMDSLVVVHRCDRCQHLSLVRELNDDAAITGIFLCSACGYSGQLHPEIVTRTEYENSDER